MAGYTEKKFGAVEKRLEELERRLSVNAFEAQKKLDELDKFGERAKMNFLEIEKKLVTLEEKPSASAAPQKIVERIVERPFPEPAKAHESLEKRFDEKLEERFKQMEDLLMLLELEVVKSKEHGSQPAEFVHEGIPKEWEDKLGVLEAKLQAIEKTKIKIPAERLNVDERLRSIEDNFLSLEARMKEEVGRVENMVSGKALTEESTERFLQKVHDRIEELRRDVDRAQLLKNEILQREKDFAKRADFDNFQNFVSSEIAKIKQVVDRVAALERSIDTHLIDIEERVRSEVQKHSQNWKTDIASHRRDIDLAVIKVEEKMLTTLSEEMKRIEQVMGNQRADIENLIKVERQTERELEARATRIVTKELAEFSSLIDKRFPHLVSRSDFEKLSAEALSRIERVEAPDTGPIMRRIQEIEKRLNEFYNIINQIATRMPLVME